LSNMLLPYLFSPYSTTTFLSPPADGSVLCRKDLVAAGLHPIVLDYASCLDNSKYGAPGLAFFLPDNSAVVELQWQGDCRPGCLLLRSLAACTDQQVRPGAAQLLQACRKDLSAGVEAIGSVLRRYPELLHLTDDAGMSLSMHCCVALTANEGDTAATHRGNGGTLKLLAAGAGCAECVDDADRK
jgi:hypothetical protein